MLGKHLSTRLFQLFVNVVAYLSSFDLCCEFFLHAVAETELLSCHLFKFIAFITFIKYGSVLCILTAFCVFGRTAHRELFRLVFFDDTGTI